MFRCNICPEEVEVINTFEDPVVTEESHPRAAVAGQAYFLTSQRQSLANNASLFLQITNPVGSGRVLHIGRIVVTSNSNLIITLNRNGSFAAAGTSITPVNANFASTNTSVATVKFVNQVADPTVGGAIFADLIQPAAGGSVPFEYNGRIIMPPGTTLLVRELNNSGGNNIVSLNISFWETTR
ncbi:hypothetical protein ACH0BK_28715 [Priestia megaterium]|uniref:hypothetical protein n=1 Tax=Priestia megaterium TaxID=1404 RepID=UPI003879E24C